MRGHSFSLRTELALAGDTIVTSTGDALLGWQSARERESGRTAAALTFPGTLLAATPSTTVLYAGNLPAPKTDFCSNLTPLLEGFGEVPYCIRPSLEEEFLKASLAGGRTGVATPDGLMRPVSFRWLCASASREELVWLCFVRVGGDEAVWRALPRPYTFHPRSGMPIEAAPEASPLDPAVLGNVALRHPTDGLTSFPCRSGRVKLIALESDGWAERRLSSLVLSAAGSVEARFSDGTRATIGVVAPQAAALAA